MKVAIIGTVPLSKRVAPFGDPAWDIWVCSPGNSQGSVPPRTTAWFELHAIVDMIGLENASWCPQYFAWLRAQTFPVWMQERNEHVPLARVFPRNALVERWGESKTRTNWFTSSIAWMMAFAIHQMRPLDGPADPDAEIGIFGVDMAATEEHYSWQKAGCLRFIEIARELGIAVTIPLESTLSYGCPQYGYAEASRMGRSLIVREHEIRGKISELEGEARRAELQVSFFRGALEQVTFDRRTFVSGRDDAEIDAEEVAKQNVAHLARAVTDGAIEGEAAAMAAFAPNDSGVLVPQAPTPMRTVPPTADDFAGSPGAALLKPPVKRKPNGSAEVDAE